jgi:transcriptional regulator with XRE-family HTH domain
MSEPPTIPVLVGRRVRALRTEAGRSQDELAEAARRAGLQWTRASVASLETGRRGLSAEELLLLPLALAVLDGRGHTVSELLEGASTVTPGATRAPVRTDFLRDLVTGAADPVGGSEHMVAPDLSDDDGRAVSHMVARETERHAARALNVEPERVVRAAYRRWGRGLTEERWLRVGARILGLAPDSSEGLIEELTLLRSGEPEIPPRTRQALRGHVTRELIEELRQTIDEEDSHG